MTQDWGLRVKPVGPLGHSAPNFGRSIALATASHARISSLRLMAADGTKLAPFVRALEPSRFFLHITGSVFGSGQGHLCPPGELKRRKKQKRIPRPWCFVWFRLTCVCHGCQHVPRAPSPHPRRAMLKALDKAQESSLGSIGPGDLTLRDPLGRRMGHLACLGPAGSV